MIQISNYRLFLKGLGKGFFGRLLRFALAAKSKDPIEIIRNQNSSRLLKNQFQRSKAISLTSYYGVNQTQLVPTLQEKILSLNTETPEKEAQSFNSENFVFGPSTFFLSKEQELAIQQCLTSKFTQLEGGTNPWAEVIYLLGIHQSASQFDYDFTSTIYRSRLTSDLLKTHLDASKSYELIDLGGNLGIFSANIISHLGNVKRALVVDPTTNYSFDASPVKTVVSREFKVYFVERDAKEFLEENSKSLLYSSSHGLSGEGETAADPSTEPIYILSQIGFSMGYEAVGASIDILKTLGKQFLVSEYFSSDSSHGWSVEEQRKLKRMYLDKSPLFIHNLYKRQSCESLRDEDEGLFVFGWL